MTSVDDNRRNLLMGGIAVAAASGAAAMPAHAMSTKSSSGGPGSDREEIENLIRMERYYRDQWMWDELANSYTSDSRVRVSWFSGSGKEFAVASRKAAEGGSFSFHQILPTKIEINGARALTDSYGVIICPAMRAGGKRFALVAYSRFLSCVRKTDAGWRMVTFDCIYQGDFLVPAQPGSSLPVDVDTSPDARWSYGALAACGKAGNVPINTDLAGIDRPELVDQLMNEVHGWLATGKFA